jgi:hypothetical protein
MVGERAVRESESPAGFFEVASARAPERTTGGKVRVEAEGPVGVLILACNGGRRADDGAVRAEVDRPGFVKGASPSGEKVETVESTESTGWVRLVCGRGFDWVADEEIEIVRLDFEEPETGAMTDEGARTAGFCGCVVALSFA